MFRPTLPPLRSSARAPLICDVRNQGRKCKDDPKAKIEREVAWIILSPKGGQGEEGIKIPTRHRLWVVPFANCPLGPSARSRLHRQSASLPRFLRQRNFPRTAKYVRTRTPHSLPHLPLGHRRHTARYRRELMQGFRQTRTCPPGQDLGLENLT